MNPIIFLSPLSIAFSLTTLSGVVIHDTKIDQFTSTYLAPPAVVASYEGRTAIKQSDPHTHSERVSLSQFVRGMAANNPRLQPRVGEEKKYALQKKVMKGQHPFDNYSLPAIG